MFGPKRLWQRALAGIVCIGMISQAGQAAQHPAHRGHVRRVQYCPPGCQPQFPHSSMQPEMLNVPAESSPQAGGNSGAPGSPGSAQNAPSLPSPMATPFQDQNFNNAPQPNFNPATQNNAIASTNTSGFGSQAPNMIGDYFGTFGSSFDPIIGGGLFPPASPDITGNLGGAPGSNVGRVKLAENVSPIPRDRVFVNYSYFNDVNIAGGGIDVHRVTPGFEKTFLNGNASIELRTPFADTVSSTVTPAGPQTSATEFGNMTVWMKALLISGKQGGLASGLGLALPTADDYVVDAGPVNSLAVNNSAVHYLPYIGGVYTPDDRWFTQGLVQLDFDGSGNRVYTGDLAAPTLEGRAKDNTYMFIDVSIGYWVYKTNHRHDTIQGIAPVIEVHHNTSLGRGSAFDGATLDLAAPGSQHVTNMVFGINTKIHNGKSLTFGYVTPVGGDDQFDKEFRVMFNWIPGT